MKQASFIFYVILLFLFSCRKDEPIPEATFPVICNNNFFSRIFDGSGAWAVVQTNDKGFVVERANGVIFKIDSLGNVIWTNTYAAMTTGLDKTVDGNIIFGCRFAAGNDKIIKLDVNTGNQLNIQGFGLGQFIATSDGGLIETLTNSIVKYNSGLSNIWTYTHSFNGGFVCSYEQPDGFLLGGKEMAAATGAQSHPYLLKLSASGTYQWSKPYTMLPSNYYGDFYVKDLLENPDKTIMLLVGSSNYVMKVDSLGNTLWQQDYKDYISYATRIFRQSNGYIVIGSLYGDFQLLKIDLNGNVLYTKSYGGIGNEYCEGSNKTQNGFVIVGYTANYTGQSHDPSKYDIYLVKTDSTGNTCY